MNQLKSIYNIPFKDSHSHPVHICFPIIASNATYKILTLVHTGLFISFKAVPAIVTVKPPFVEPVAEVMADILGFKVTNREPVKYFKFLR